MPPKVPGEHAPKPFLAIPPNKKLFIRGAFTLIELLLVIAIVAILLSMLLPAIGKAKSRAHVAQCANNLAQLALALTMYADDSEDEFPPRSVEPSWIELLKPYYVKASVLKCPTANDLETRTYILNGFNDWFEQNLNPFCYEDYKEWQWPHGLRVSAVENPSDTITFGEKFPGSPHVHMDFFQRSGNDLEEIAHARHPIGFLRGGSNHAFVDSSVRYLPYGRSINPVNL